MGNVCSALTIISTIRLVFAIFEQIFLKIFFQFAVHCTVLSWDCHCRVEIRSVILSRSANDSDFIIRLVEGMVLLLGSLYSRSTSTLPVISVREGTHINSI